MLDASIPDRAGRRIVGRGPRGRAGRGARRCSRTVREHERGGWRWGALHRVRFAHPLARMPGLAPVFVAAEHELGGDEQTVLQGGFDARDGFDAAVVPSWRFVADLADLDRLARACAPTGQSGQPGVPALERPGAALDRRRAPPGPCLAGRRRGGRRAPARAPARPVTSAGAMPKSRQRQRGRPGPYTTPPTKKKPEAEPPLVRLPRPRPDPARAWPSSSQLHGLHPRRDPAVLALGRAGAHRGRLRRRDPVALTAPNHSRVILPSSVPHLWNAAVRPRGSWTTRPWRSGGWTTRGELAGRWPARWGKPGDERGQLTAGRGAGRPPSARRSGAGSGAPPGASPGTRCRTRGTRGRPRAPRRPRPRDARAGPRSRRGAQRRDPEPGDGEPDPDGGEDDPDAHGGRARVYAGSGHPTLARWAFRPARM